ncbi:FAD/NAD(P)-binding protein [Streptomyces sp. NPDC096198]|uniref:FAD/NAD(P)-binding protein n=1 Tax=Streptomyces sp. NPDC096198 TaxID=3366080 RepID=UPI0037F1D641
MPASTTDAPPASPDAAPVSVALVGAGPRGTSVLERLCASATELLPRGARLTVHVVDPAPPGPGRVWRTAQPPELLMNTVACQVTLFTDESVECAGPLRPGPSLYEWAQEQRAPTTRELTHPDGPSDPYPDGRPHPDPDSRPSPGLSPNPSPGLSPNPSPDLSTDPDGYPARAQYGRYLEWVFSRVVDGAPEAIRVEVHTARAIRLRDAPDGGQTLTLSTGRTLTGLSAVVLAQGHLPVVADPEQQRHTAHAARHGLRHIPPANPADIDLTVLAPGEPVLLRGLGLNFFDHMALLTAGRGGRFDRAPDGRLRYRPSGREPRLYAGSRRGIPHQARGDNEKGPYGRHTPLLLTGDTIAAFRKRAEAGESPDFSAEIWPLVAKEVETVYYEALLARRGTGRPGFRERFLAAPHGGTAEGDLLGAYGIAPADRWDWDRVARPHTDRTFASPAEWRGWLLGHLREDAAQAALGNVRGPLKAALDVLRDLRNELRLIIDHGGLSGTSRRDQLDRWYTPLNAFLSIGPPRRRIEELTALIEAGVLEVLGPRLTVRAEDGGWTAHSPEVPGSAVRVRTLLEARLPEPDLRRTADPLLADLLGTGGCRPHAVGGYETGGLDVTPRPYRVIDRRGAAHPSRFAFGGPTEGVHWVTAAGARPGVDSVTLADADAVARAVLRAAGAEAESRAERRRSGTLAEC